MWTGTVTSVGGGNGYREGGRYRGRDRDRKEDSDSDRDRDGDGNGDGIRDIDTLQYYKCETKQI
jgi:hypothetical protein